MTRDRLRDLYNPEHDIIANNVIPWYAVMLLNELEKLEGQIIKLENNVSALNLAVEKNASHIIDILLLLERMTDER